MAKVNLEELEKYAELLLELESICMEEADFARECDPKCFEIKAEKNKVDDSYVDFSDLVDKI